MITLDQRERRHFRLRKKVFGTSKRPRLSVTRSNANLFVQIVDDTQAKTLASSSSYKLKGTKIEQAEMLGGQIAEIAKKSKIKRVVFDRGGNKFHGRIKALAEAARKAGLEF